MNLPSNATPQQREAFEERAAIKEYQGNMSREQAERAAFCEIFYPKKEQPIVSSLDHSDPEEIDL